MGAKINHNSQDIVFCPRFALNNCMRQNFRIVAVTPAGRRRYLEVLFRYLERDRSLIDEWHLWLNTANAADIKYCTELEHTYPWIKTIPLDNAWDGSYSIHHFFTHCTDPNTVYIRFDDDIVWIEPKGLEKLVQFRIDNPDYFLVFPNIVNNSIMSHLHQRMGCIPLPGLIGYEVLDPVGWRSGPKAVEIHETFLKKLKENSLDDYKFGQWNLFYHERFSINSFAFLGKTFKEFGGRVGRDEETWLSHQKVHDSHLFNCIFGRCLMVHFAYHTQRDHIENTTTLLKQYRKLAGA